MVKLKVHILVGYVPFFDQESYIMSFSEKNFRNFERSPVLLSLFSDYLLFYVS